MKISRIDRQVLYIKGLERVGGGRGAGEGVECYSRGKTFEENSLFLVAFQLVTRVNRYPRNTWLSTGTFGYPIISDYAAFSRSI